MGNNQQTFKNNSITVIATQKPGCNVHLEVTVSPQATQAGYKKAISAVKKEVSIPGFRKGKAPDDLILKNYTKPIDSEWKEIVMKTALNDAVKLSNLRPFNNNIKSALLKSISMENGSIYTFEYESTPTIPSIVPADLSISKVALKSVTDEAVAELIENLCLQQAEWTPIADRGAQDGDFVVVNIDDISGNPRKICENTLLRVTKDKMDPWMRNLIIGLKAGESAEGMSEAPKHDDNCDKCTDGTHSHSHDENFIPTLCRISVNEVKQATPHVLDDEFVKQFGATNVEDLKEKARKMLENQAEAEKKDKERRLMEKAIFEKYSFDIPSSLVGSEVAAMEKAIEEKLRAENVPADKINAEKKKIRDQIADKYERDFLLYFITQKAAREHGVKVSKDEVAMEMMKQMFLEQQGQGYGNFSGDLKTQQMEIEMRLQAVKVLDFLIEKCCA